MRRQWVIGAALVLVAVGVVATVAVAMDVPSKDTVALTSNLRVISKVSNKRIHATITSEPSKVDTSAAMVTVRGLLTPEALAKAKKIKFTKVRFTDPMGPADIADNALVWIVSVDGFRSTSHGGAFTPESSRVAWDQMNLVIDANTGEYLEGYPGVVGNYPGEAP